MQPYGNSSYEISKMHRGEIQAQREAIRQAKLAKRAAESVRESQVRSQPATSHVGALRRIFARAPRAVRFSYLSSAHHG